MILIIIYYLYCELGAPGHKAALYTSLTKANKIRTLAVRHVLGMANETRAPIAVPMGYISISVCTCIYKYVYI